MKNTIIKNLFEFWMHIGINGQFLYNTKQYNYVKPSNYSWPNKIFGVNESEVNLKKLYLKIKNEELPNSVSILENKALEAQLIEHLFILKSSVKGMYLNLHEKDRPTDNFATIEKVNTITKANEFATIASNSFGYEILSSTIIALVSSSQLKLFIGKYNNKYVSCGMVFLDKNGISGLHMIGTLPNYRGFGLGKVMTNKLMLEVFKNESKQVVLVASKSGERIYSKLGFKAEGSLLSYSIKK